MMVRDEGEKVRRVPGLDAGNKFKPLVSPFGCFATPLRSSQMSVGSLRVSSATKNSHAHASGWPCSFLEGLIFEKLFGKDIKLVRQILI